MPNWIASSARAPDEPAGYSYYLRGSVKVGRIGNAFITGDAAGLATRDMCEGIGPAIRSGHRAADAILTARRIGSRDVTGASLGGGIASALLDWAFTRGVRALGAARGRRNMPARCDKIDERLSKRAAGAGPLPVAAARSDPGQSRRLRSNAIRNRLVLVPVARAIQRSYSGGARCLRAASAHRTGEAAEIAARSEASAAEHGLHRWQQGYHQRETIREWSHLQLLPPGRAR